MASNQDLFAQALKRAGVAADLLDRMERWYEAWCDNPAYLDECDEHGSQRAAFFAGVHAGAAEIRRLESATASGTDGGVK